MISRSVFALLCLLLCSLINMSSADVVDYDLLIKNGRIVDGSGRPSGSPNRIYSSIRVR